MHPTYKHIYKRSFVLNMVLAIEAAALAVASVWCWMADIDLLPLFKIESVWQPLSGVVVGIAISIVSLAFTHAAKRLGERISWLSLFDDLVMNVMAPVFANITLTDIILIAIASGFCEEVLYRGVLQTQFGIWIAAAIFGLCHFAGTRYIVYVIWAFFAGLLFGYLLILTNCIWTPICAHMASNFISICLLRYKIAPLQQQLIDDEEDK